MNTIISISLLVAFLAVFIVPILPNAIGTAPSKATIMIDTTSGSVTAELNNGEKFAFAKAAKVPLGGTTCEDDPDTIIASANDGKDIIVIRFMNQDGKKVFDGDGLLSASEHMYDLAQDGDVVMSGNTVTVHVLLKHVKVAEGEMAKHDEVQLPPEQPGKRNLQPELPVPLPDNVKRAVVRKRAATEYWLELAIYVDQGFYDAYVTKYAEQAENKINNFIEAAVLVMESDFKTLPTPVHLSVKKYQIWKTQPADFSAESKEGGDVYEYLKSLTSSDFNPAKVHVDHTMLFTGYNLLPYWVLGIANYGQVCISPEKAGSIMNSFNLAIGEIASHELAHSMYVHHDGYSALTHGEEIEIEKACNESGYLMSPYMKSSSAANLLFSPCSKQKFAWFFQHIENNDINCLTKPEICEDINNANYCSYPKQDLKYCSWGIRNQYCEPLSAFPSAQAGGNCKMEEMCRQTCNLC